MINKLVANIKKTGAPIVVGLDPMLNYIPEQVQETAFEEYGETLEGAAEAIWQFNKAIIDATYDLIPAVKPQIAMYEQFGIPGTAVAFKKTVDYCKEKRFGCNRRYQTRRHWLYVFCLCSRTSWKSCRLEAKELCRHLMKILQQ